MFDLPHVAARLYGVPLLVARDKLETILAAVGPRVLGTSGAPLVLDQERPEPEASRYATNETRMGTPVTMEGVAIVPAYGTMIRRGSWLDAASGLTSYAWIEDTAQAAFADPQVRGVMLELDTSGGEAGGCFDTADRLRTMRREFGKPLWAMSNEAALSAGYGLACAADEIWLARTAEVGSIGVFAAHIDQSAKDAKDGLAWTYIFAGAQKVDGHPHAPLNDDVLARIQADVDGLYSMFVDQVAAARGLSAEAVRATEAAVYRGADAVKAGLADEVGTMTDALSAMVSTLEGRALPRPARASSGGLAPAETATPAAPAITHQGIKPMVQTQPLAPAPKTSAALWDDAFQAATPYDAATPAAKAAQAEALDELPSGWGAIVKEVAQREGLAVTASSAGWDAAFQRADALR